MRGALPVLLGIGLLPFFWASCGGTVTSSETEWGEPDASGGPDAKKDAAKDGHADAKDAGKDALPDYFDPGCPDAPAPIIDNVCDPLAPPPGDCLEDEACYPYVVYPTEPCQAEMYGSMCAPAGTAKQDEPCDYDMCAAGYVCVVTGAGTVCVRMCELDKIGACPDGRVCEPIDVLGYGGCL